jgi:phosphohistidine phosphatase
MKLYIVRHAIAVPRGTPGMQDDDRPLTEEGIQKMRQAAAGLRNLDYVPELILSSPLPRARQTAEILLEAFGKDIKMKLLTALAPTAARRDLYPSIEAYEKKLKSLMLVGHQPSLGEIAGEIVWGSPEHFIELKKGGACAIELERVGDPPKGVLLSLLTPSILRRVAVR